MSKTKHKKVTWVLSVLKQKKVITGLLLIIIPLVILNFPILIGFSLKEIYVILSMVPSLPQGIYVMVQILVSLLCVLTAVGILLVALGIHKKIWRQPGTIINAKTSAVWISALIIVAGIGAYFLMKPREEGEPTSISDESMSGNFMGNFIWSGEILITGDTHIGGDLTILPGTVVRFAVQDDQNSGGEIPADGYNDLDPTRLPDYDKTHSRLFVLGKLTAKGTPEDQILFTSAAEEPNYADWVSVCFGGDGSIMEYCIVEWSRNGITPGRNQPNTIIRNNVINYTFWGSISSGFSGAQICNNEIWETGHEGIDVQGGDPIIENNRIYNAHAGIVILSGSATVRNNTMINVGDGVHVADQATPILENNHVEFAPDNSTKEWRYGNFAYTLIGEPVGAGVPGEGAPPAEGIPIVYVVVGVVAIVAVIGLVFALKRR